MINGVVVCGNDFSVPISFIPPLYVNWNMVCCRGFAPFHLILRAREDVCLYLAKI